MPWKHEDAERNGREEKGQQAGRTKTGKGGRASSRAVPEL